MTTALPDSLKHDFQVGNFGLKQVGRIMREFGWVLVSSALAIVIAGCSDNDQMVTVSEGWFWQGCNPAVDACYDDTVYPDFPQLLYEDELPYHRLYLQSFEIDKHEVTVEMYEECMAAGGCSAPSTQYTECNWGIPGREQHPVNCIDWYQAWAFCGWSDKRLCSESEWEKASRGEDGRRYPWGNDLPTCQYAVMDGCGRNETLPVGSKPDGASPCGALDMSGNVWEWVEDDYHDNYDGAPADGSAWLDVPRSKLRIIRGGSVFDSWQPDLWLRSFKRYDMPADYTGEVGFEVGFRCCRNN